MRQPYPHEESDSRWQSDISEEAEEDLELPEMRDIVSGEFDRTLVIAGLLGGDRYWCELGEEVVETSTRLTESGGR